MGWFQDRVAANRPYIIAEVGVNHEGDLDLACRLIALAADGGADAVKFQTYRASTLASRNSPAYWDRTEEPTASQFELFSKYDRFWKSEYELLSNESLRHGVDFLSTPFDFESADFLADLMPAFKVASSDLTNKPFLEHLAGFKKPILQSTGAADLSEITRSVSWLRDAGCTELGLLHCVLSYPTRDEDANLARILGLKDAFPNVLAGYSDHTRPGAMAALDYAQRLGAIILEKHFTHDKTLPGNDHYHAMDRDDLKRLKSRFEAFRSMEEIQSSPLFGSSDVRFQTCELAARKHARRSLVVTSGLRKGTALNSKHLTFKRPGHGIPPYRLSETLGRKLAVDLPVDTVLLEEHLAAP